MVAKRFLRLAALTMLLCVVSLAPRLPFAPATLNAAAYSTKVGAFAQAGSTGNQAVTGVGFQPKAVIFTMTNLVSDGPQANARIVVGWAASSSARAAVSNSADDAGVAGTTTARRAARTGKCLVIMNGAGTVQSEADFVSMDSDGFTVNWTTADATARQVNYLALGGTDITNVATGVFSSPASNSSLGVTGVGFKPDFVLLGSILSSTSPDNATGQAAITLGAAGGGGQGLVSEQLSQNPNSPAFRYQRSSKIMAQVQSAGTVQLEADFTSFDTDGFTLNYTTTSGDSQKVVYLAIKGGNYKVGAFNQATSTGNQAVTGTGFTPSALMLMTYGEASSASVQNHYRLSVGMATGTSARSSVFAGATNNTTVVTVDDSVLSSTRVIQAITEPSTVNADADFVSFDSNGFTINNTTADATSRQILYMAMGPAGNAFPAAIINSPLKGGGGDW